MHWSFYINLTDLKYKTTILFLFRLFTTHIKYQIIMLKQQFVIVTFPAQGHINPAFQFAEHLIRLGVHVTFFTTIGAHRRGMIKSPPTDGLSFTTFSDGYDDGVVPMDDAKKQWDQLKCNGSKALTDLIVSTANKQCIVYTMLLPWVADVARELHLPSALLWIQPAMVFDIYYYYYNGFTDVIGNDSDDRPSCSIQLPGLPLLATRDLPSFLLASNPYALVLPQFQAQLEALVKESNPRVLMNTFDALEPEALKALEKLNLVSIGPLVPYSILDGRDPSNGSKNYIKWLNSKSESSVIYVSFGSLLVLKKQQMEEIARGLLDCGRPFLWVIRAKESGEEEELSCREELEQMGMIVPWCSQVEVLSHPSLGCFVTHCGWNSTLESLVLGVPMVAFPQWSDQGTNAKLIEDVWKTGVRVTVNKDGIVEGDEIKRCLELAVGDGERREAIRRNAKKWKELAIEAAKEVGSSYNNLKAFVDEIGEVKVAVKRV
ncbi:phloretin 4'-O-glucosyltransferase-like [Quercus robur]|uniref:phloretin 4'-O-glucosyltransferase-like n=1 Tax=Quercus robur TaxID=38942 RepID=UPI00216248D3|nr:phloretin 4'-O-glucosyltransferase-like [Quercus robur]